MLRQLLRLIFFCLCLVPTTVDVRVVVIYSLEALYLSLLRVDYRGRYKGFINLDEMDLECCWSVSTLGYSSNVEKIDGSNLELRVLLSKHFFHSEKERSGRLGDSFLLNETSLSVLIPRLHKNKNIALSIYPNTHGARRSASCCVLHDDKSPRLTSFPGNRNGAIVARISHPSAV